MKQRLDGEPESPDSHAIVLYVSGKSLIMMLSEILARFAGSSSDQTAQEQTG